MPTAFLIAVHLVLTAVLLAYVADVAMPFYVYRSNGIATTAKAVTPIAWSQAPLLFVSQAELYTQQLAQHVISSDVEEASRLNSEVLWRSSLCHFLLAAVTYAVLTRVVPAPYGRHAQRLRLRLSLPSRVSWALQESPTLFNVLYFVALEFPRAMGHGPFTKQGKTTPLSSGACASYGACVWTACTQQHLGLLLFVIHYVHRSWIYPLAIPTSASRVPLVVTWSATLYCIFNGRLQVLASASAAAAGGGSNPLDRLQASVVEPLRVFWSVFSKTHTSSGSPSAAATPSFVIEGMAVAALTTGLACFFYGQWTNVRADYYLVSLRGHKSETSKKGSGATSASDPSATAAAAIPTAKGRYLIPVGGWFDVVSCANFLGELIEWAGYVVVVAATTTPVADLAAGDTGMNSLSRVPRWSLPFVVVVHTNLRAFARALTTPYVVAALSFWVYVWCNLAPRAVEHHRWYSSTFGRKYDRLRRSALIPGIL